MELRVALEDGLRVREHGLRPLELRAGLASIELGKELALADPVALLGMDGQHGSREEAVDADRAHRLDRAGHDDRAREIAGRDRDDGDGDRAGSAAGLSAARLAPAPAGGSAESHQ